MGAVILGFFPSVTWPFPSLCIHFNVFFAYNPLLLLPLPVKEFFNFVLRFGRKKKNLPSSKAEVCFSLVL